MDFRAIITMGLDEYLSELKKALAGLSPEERRFQSTPDSSHVDFLVWHMARVEDYWVQWNARGTDMVWQRDGWPERLGLPEAGNGWGYTAEQVRDLPAFDMDEVISYFDSVREGTLDFVEGLTPADLDRAPLPRPNPNAPDTALGKVFSHLIVEESQHVGQVAYIRGLQRGIDNRRSLGKEWDN